MLSTNARWLLASLLSFACLAKAAPTANDQDSVYFTISDSSSKRLLKTPSDMLQDGFDAMITVTRLDLLRWLRHDGPKPVSPEPYNRKQHFGVWVNDPHDTTCFNTRAKTLIRDSKVPVTFKPHNRCLVDTGLWEDPYTGGTRTSAREIQIDHVVPLKNAFISGAWTWSAKKRCLYANFMANNFHLMAVDGFENMSKGDSAPDQYIPANRRYVCQYLQEWLKIKLIWKLEMTQSEAEAIKNNLSQFGCDSKDLKMLQSDLNEQRLATEDMQAICEKMADRMEKASTKSRSTEASSRSGETL